MITTTAELDRAVAAVRGALVALRADPTAGATGPALRRATAAVGALEPDLTSTVLSRLLLSIEECLRAGRRDSPRLALCTRTTARALRLDPRWSDRAAVPVGAGRDAC
jgi:hypothetical protein